MSTTGVYAYQTSQGQRWRIKCMVTPRTAPGARSTSAGKTKPEAAKARREALVASDRGTYSEPSK